MDNSSQISKLISLLHRIARSVRTAEDDTVVTYSREQYNRVLDQLGQLDPGTTQVFKPLGEEASGEVVAAACRNLAAYFREEDDLSFDTETFRSFLKQSAQDLEDVGDFIRETLGAWKRGHREQSERTTNGESEHTDQGQSI